MKDIYEKFLSKCSKENQDIIQKYIDISIEEKNNGKHWGTKKHSILLSNSLDLNFLNCGLAKIKENNFDIALGSNSVMFYITSPFIEEYTFSTSVILEIHEITHEKYKVIFGLDDNDFNSYFEIAIQSELGNNFSIKNIEKDPEVNIKSNINWHDKNIVEFILQNYCTPENIKNLSSIVCDLDFEKDVLLKIIYKNAQLLDQKISSKKRNSLK